MHRLPILKWRDVRAVHWNHTLRKRGLLSRTAAIAALATLAVVVPIRAQATAVRFIPVADAFVSSAYPTTNYGSSTTLRANTSPVVRSYLRVTVQGLTAPVTKATLKLFALDGSSAGYQVRKVTDNTWGEKTITYSNAPTVSTTVTGTSGAFSASTWTNVDVTSVITGNGTYSFALVKSTAGRLRFWSREGDRAPRLAIEYGSDTTPPTPPGSVQANAVDFNWVDVSWSASNDTSGVAGYTIYRNGAVVAKVSKTTFSHADTTVAPGTRYDYQVEAFDAAGNESARSAAAITTPSRPSYPVIAAAGDIACDPDSASFNAGNGTAGGCRQKFTSNSLVNANFSAVLPLGDTQYDTGVYDEYLESYDPSWGRVKSVTRPAVGNHEYGTSGAAGYYQYFGTLAGDPTKGYYSYDLGSWHLIALNSNIARDAASDQVKWLTDDLGATTKPCILAYWHHARWSSSASHGSDSSVAPFWNALYAAGADIVLAGHDHDYERFALQNPTGGADAGGIREFVVGTGGRSLYGFSTPLATSQVRNNTQFGVLMLKLQASSYSWRFVPEAGGFFTDSGTTACH